ncbi:component of small subunit processosome [Scheffersomyces amazonensis]|uniref:component of small subunit processosome n=1 Tax=Scheffersomyces amazonensis TaxID=1078765 RepID=UPI00315D3D46
MTSVGPVICAKFDPTISYLASGVIALDTHQIKVKSINSSQTSLNTSFSLEKSNKLTNLSWISINKSHSILAINLTKGSTLIYSAQTNEIIAELSSTKNLSIVDFHYSKLTHSGWSCDIEGNIYEWDLNNFSLIQHFNLNDLLETAENVNRISTVLYNNEPHLLVGSHSIYLININQKEIIKTFPGHIQPINNIFPLSDNKDLFLTSAKGDRFINLYSIEKGSTKSVFVSQSSVSDIAYGVQDNKSILIVINENNNLEIFNDIFGTSTKSQSQSQPSTPSSKKKRRQQLSNVQSHSSNALLKLSRPDTEIKSPKDSNLAIDSISVNEDFIIFSWLEHSNIPYFETIKWLDDSGNYSLITEKVVFKSKPDLKVVNHSTYGHDIAAPKLYSEGHAIISDGTNLGDVLNEVEGEDEDEEEEESLAEKFEKLSQEKSLNQSTKSKKKLGGDKTGTLAVILSQSLRNNDHSLLETVLSNRDSQVIQNTIERLDPALSVILLDRLSERIQRQASRFDQLTYWLKWIVLIHGSIISSLPNLSIKLSNLHSALIKKADTLPRLLELQGRLNMLYDQNRLRKEILNLNTGYDNEDEEIDSDIEYIEEIDDAEALGILSEDEDDFDVDLEGGHDDYEEEEEEEEPQVEDGDDGDIDGSVEDEENYSDLEIDVNNDDRMEDDDE